MGNPPHQKKRQDITYPTLYQFYSILFRTQYMHSQSREIEAPLSAHSRNRVFGVIVLTDNRQNLPTDKINMPSYRCSAFRQTQADPLEFYQERGEYPEGSWRNLHKWSLPWSSDCWNWHSLRPSCRKKNQRRRLKDLIRDQQCPVCQKIYGSETLLKYHLKLKHAKHDKYHSQSN